MNTTDNNKEVQLEINLEELPYREIGEYPIPLSSGNVIKRLIDGLGYRYYRATESLTETDLSYRTSEEARSSLETLEHILDISGFVLRVARQRCNTSLGEKEKLTYTQIRHQTLQALKEASDLMGQLSEKEMKSLDIKVQQGDHKFSLPLWHLLNGPLSDALCHVGQVVAFPEPPEIRSIQM